MTQNPELTYQILAASTVEALERDVNDAMAAGWRPLDGMRHISANDPGAENPVCSFYQTLVRDPRPSPLQNAIQDAVQKKTAELQGLVDAVRDTATFAAKPEPATDTKYGAIVAEKKQFHPGEPLFILRAQDPLASAAISEYAALCRRNNCVPAHVEDVQAESRRFRQWQTQNQDLVKRLPGEPVAKKA